MQALLARSRAGLHCSRPRGVEDAVYSYRRLYSSFATLLLRYINTAYFWFLLYFQVIWVQSCEFVSFVFQVCVRFGCCNEVLLPLPPISHLLCHLEVQSVE